MGRTEDLTGQKFGMLTVIGRAPNKSNNVRWNCICDCGNETIQSTSHLTSGHTKSCGCFRVRYARESHTIHGCGFDDNRLYRIWKHMKERCSNPNVKCYKRYGGKGVKVCDEWLHDFKAFYDWAMANGYSEDLTLDRIDYNGSYSPENCRWATYKQQANNTSRNLVYEYDGRVMTLSQWSEYTGINYMTLMGRIKRGLPLEDVFNPHIRTREDMRPRITIDGIEHTVDEWSEISGVPVKTIMGRINHRWEPKRAVFQPIRQKKTF